MSLAVSHYSTITVAATSICADCLERERVIMAVVIVHRRWIGDDIREPRLYPTIGAGVMHGSIHDRSDPDRGEKYQTERSSLTSCRSERSNIHQTRRHRTSTARPVRRRRSSRLARERYETRVGGRVPSWLTPIPTDTSCVFAWEEVVLIHQVSPLPSLAK